MKKNDTLTQLARDAHTTLAELARLNGLDINATLQIGQPIELPVAD